MQVLDLVPSFGSRFAVKKEMNTDLIFRINHLRFKRQGRCQYGVDPQHTVHYEMNSLQRLLLFQLQKNANEWHVISVDRNVLLIKHVNKYNFI